MPIRVLHAPENTAGNPQGLAQAEREIGLASRVVSLHPGPFGMDSDEVLWADGPKPWIAELRRFRLLVRACREFDVVHFNFGLTMMPSAVPTGTPAPDGLQPAVWRAWRAYSRLLEQRDLALLARLGKGIVVTFQGDDARQGRGLAPEFLREVGEGYYSAANDAQKRRRIERFNRHAHRIFAVNPDLLRVLPPTASFLPYASVDPRDWVPVVAPSGVPLVVHAPSHRGVKGTRFVLEAVERLKSEGARFEFALAENLPHGEARRLYERAAVVVDQLLVGWYGALAVEAMALGKPVVSFVRDEDLVFVPRAMREELPIVNATPATVYEALRSLLSGPRETLLSLGERGRAFVEHWHDPHRVASETRAAYEQIVGRRGSATP